MSEDKDTTPELTLIPPPMSREVERKAKNAARIMAYRASPEGKAKRLARKKAYREANKEKIAADKRADREANPAKFAAKDKAYRESNKERLKAYEATPERKARTRAREGTPERKAYYKARYKAYCEANPDKVKRCSRARGATSDWKAYYADYNCTRRYGLTVQQRDSMILAQGNRCLCCKTLFGLLRAHKPQIDHCHRTGKVRGILCTRCNLLLGHADDKPSILRTCARYLERSVQEVGKSS